MFAMKFLSFYRNVSSSFAQRFIFFTQRFIPKLTGLFSLLDVQGYLQVRSEEINRGKEVVMIGA